MKKHYLLTLLLLFKVPAAWAQPKATGTVYHDLNKNNRRDAGEPPLAGVCVSNGREVVTTDRAGKWVLPAGDDVGFFVIKPAGYAPPTNAQQLPQHYYLHKPQGSPALAVRGVDPTGPLPASIDFPLWKQDEPGTFSVLLFGDPQARGIREVNFVTRDVVEQCVGTSARLGITLGDIVADDPNLFQEINESIAQIGIPWYNVFGNHDFNRGATHDRFSDETFERFYGPSTYAFEYGQVVFITLKNIYFNADGKYKGHFTDEQLAFVKNYLAQVPTHKRVVLLMHAPVISCDNRAELFRLLEKRPHTLSIAGHTHEMAHVFVDQKYGWNDATPHHHFINATVCGSWWCGTTDELGIPHATMNDGAPNGYSVLSFEGNEYSLRFQAARRPASYQMNLYLPDDLPRAELDTTALVVNVFAGSERSVVEMKVRGLTDWVPLTYTPMRDPGIAALQPLNKYLSQKVDGVGLDTVFGWEMDKPSVAYHIWKGALPATLPVGTHTVEVRTRDMFGQEYQAHRIFRVRP
ncbi:calcineurin-like phosphoesterase family protein [Rhabdobacter roseus]|uniref:Metallophosphoesterase n=1 Tax=Rhabdobacter roseus TaxID=1655419 RepID=A0A840TVW6_9BACT|nr:calcineurin-like phosphoesterase family protein [Rhabdobacter roseus]MBB5284100.1 hypothetical protein [Rhabdobacter roseus]